MLILNLTRGDSGMRVPLRLPATPADVGVAFAKLDQISKKEKKTRIASAVSENAFLEGYLGLPVSDAGQLSTNNQGRHDP